MKLAICKDRALLSLSYSQDKSEQHLEHYNDLIPVQIPTYSLDPAKLQFNPGLASISMYIRPDSTGKDELFGFIGRACYPEYEAELSFGNELFDLAVEEFRHSRSYFVDKMSVTESERRESAEYEKVVAELRREPPLVREASSAKRDASDQTEAKIHRQSVFKLPGSEREFRRIAEPAESPSTIVMNRPGRCLPQFEPVKRNKPAVVEEEQETYSFRPSITESRQFQEVSSRWQQPRSKPRDPPEETHPFKPHINANSAELAKERRRRDAERRSSEMEAYRESLVALETKPINNVEDVKPERTSPRHKLSEHDALVKARADALLQKLEKDYNLVK